MSILIDELIHYAETVIIWSADPTDRLKARSFLVMVALLDEHDPSWRVKVESVSEIVAPSAIEHAYKLFTSSLAGVSPEALFKEDKEDATDKPPSVQPSGIAIHGPDRH